MTVRSISSLVLFFSFMASHRGKYILVEIQSGEKSGIIFIKLLDIFNWNTIKVPLYCTYLLDVFYILEPVVFAKSPEVADAKNVFEFSHYRKEGKLDFNVELF